MANEVKFVIDGETFEVYSFQLLTYGPPRLEVTVYGPDADRMSALLVSRLEIKGHQHKIEIENDGIYGEFVALNGGLTFRIEPDSFEASELSVQFKVLKMDVNDLTTGDSVL